MTYDSLCDLAKDHDIGVYDFPLKRCRALTVHIDGKCDIALDLSKAVSEAERKSLLAHEMGHCETGAFYNEKNFLETSSRAEYRADAWAVRKLLPKRAFTHALKHGCDEVWKLSEHFGVETALVIFALKLYYGIEA